MTDHLISISHAATPLLAGQVGVMPTDTVYGIVARATDEKAVTRLYHLKSRESKPGTVIAASIEQLHQLGLSYSDLERIAQWWPNSLSAVLPIQGNGYLHQNVGSLAVRIVADPTIRHLLERTGPLLTSSANLPRHPESTTIQQAYDYFGDSVDFYIDGGDMSNRAASTIIRPRSDGTIEILRQGSVHL